MYSVRNLTFSVGSCYLVFKVIAKLTFLAASIGGHATVQLPAIIRFMTKQISIWPKALIITWNCVLSYKQGIHVIPPESSGRVPEMELTSRAPGKDAKPPGS